MKLNCPTLSFDPLVTKDVVVEEHPQIEAARESLVTTQGSSGASGGETEEVAQARQLLEEMSLGVAKVTPPVYSEQGQPRGRKPKRSKLEKVKEISKGVKARKGKKSKGSKNTKSRKGRKTRKSEKVQQSEVPVVEEVPEPVIPKRKKRASNGAKGGSVRQKRRVEVVDAPAAAAAAEASGRSDPEDPDLEVSKDGYKADLDMDIPEDAIAPPDGVSMSTNSIYSGAYRRAKAMGASIELCREVT